MVSKASLEDRLINVESSLDRKRSEGTIGIYLMFPHRRDRRRKEHSEVITKFAVL